MNERFLSGEEQKEKPLLYHMVPEKMRGNILYPLSSLKEIFPDLHTEAMAEYEGREHVPETPISTLGVRFKDVLQLSPVHPREIIAALKEAGLEPREMRFFEVDPKLLDSEKAAIYLFNDKEEDVLYNPDDVAKYGALPEATKRHYLEAAAQGKRPKLFVSIPHVMYKGSIDISKLPVIKA